MGRKFKISFSSSDKDTALSYLHDLGFIPKIVNGERIQSNARRRIRFSACTC
jgi:sulfite reductase beta subunit-like hemoprotein